MALLEAWKDVICWEREIRHFIYNMLTLNCFKNNDAACLKKEHDVAAVAAMQVMGKST